jgi:hypothetical protein
MATQSRWLDRLLRGALAAALLIPLTTVGAGAQARWSVDQKASLAWWQVNPHLNHLWATTCPEEPSWRPGEGRSGGWSINPGLRQAKHGEAAVSDTSIIPLYPRPRVRPLCGEGVEGHFTVSDTVNWTGIRGEIRVKTDRLVTGDERRDGFARSAILQSGRYPDVKFVVDSVTDLRRSGDTITGTAVGVFTLRNVSQPMTASLRSYPLAGGRRVLARFHVDADDLVPVYGLSSVALGLGVGIRIWQHLYMGADLLMQLDQ